MDKKPKNTFITACLFLAVLLALTVVCSADAQTVPPAIESITAEDNSIWERVSTEGFGNSNNIGISALCAYNDNLYALTRNDVEGFQLWQAGTAGWTRLSIPGFTDSVRQPFLNGGYSAMTVFDNRLYVAVGSGYEGDMLFRSVGLEIWRFDGTVWQAVISDARSDGQKESGQITSLSDCAADDTAMTALVSDSTKAWTVNQWAGGVLKISSGDGAGRVFDIISNDNTTLTIQQNEAATEDEYTICASFAPDADRSEMTVGSVAQSDSYLVTLGWKANGFGEIWNKNLIGFEEYQGRLYLSVAHNYADGTRVWRSSDGLEWEPTSEYSFGLMHGYDMDGVETGFCLVDGYEYRNGGPVCSSATYLHASDVTGTESLFAGGTGSTGCNGRGARVLKYDGTEWAFLVDYFVDTDDEGTNENGLGDAADFLSANFQAWSWADYDDHLFLGIARTIGSRIMYTATGDTANDSWKYAVGGDGPMPDGFDGAGGLLGYGRGLGSHLYTYNNALWAACFVNAAVAGLPWKLDGADIWRATGSADALVWTRITDNAFGNRGIITFGNPVEFDDTLYVGGSNIFGNFTENAAPDGNGCLVFRLASRSDWIDLDSLDADEKKFFIDLSWTVDTSSTINGYNVYVSRNSDMLFKRKLNLSLIEDTSFIHGIVWPGSKWWYVIEAVGSDGKTAVFGPVPSTAKKFFEN